jgi:hypothetical protein
MCISDWRRWHRRPNTRWLLLRVEMWLCRWWSAAREADRNSEAEELWAAARAVSAVAAGLDRPIVPAGMRTSC